MSVERQKGKPVASDSSASAKKRRSGFWARLLREQPLGVVGGIITLLLLLTGLFADVLAPYGINDTDISNKLAPPSAEHPLGTDNLGRDMMSRVIHGARISVIVGLVGTALATFLSLIIGMMTGYLGKRFDLVVQRFVDLLMSIPGIVLLMVVIASIGAGMWQVILVVGIRRGIIGSRVIRGAVIGIKENMYLAAARATGSPRTQIILRHVLPNIMATAIVLFSVRVPGIIMTEASLSFLGFGIPPPAPSWGGMLSGTGRSYMFLAPWMVIWPGLALTTVVYGINMFGDAVRDLLDPRLRGGAGRYNASEAVQTPDETRSEDGQAPGSGAKPAGKTEGE
jgi:peptide/nickel transport system permease protein